MVCGDEVTLIAKWRDYQYIIKYSVKYSDKTPPPAPWQTSRHPSVRM